MGLLIAKLHPIYQSSEVNLYGKFFGLVFVSKGFIY